MWQNSVVTSQGHAKKAARIRLGTGNTGRGKRLLETIKDGAGVLLRWQTGFFVINRRHHYTPSASRRA